ncbi:hypothetical protein Pmani_016282 [Petrolisthes manimaculis]|uniref:Uncharacterized protein n=1 Tax=Petrolisthes manimaculis TaxID=1843537 RepID=A0AAE1PPE4_9EUCA|nr:hypothetical protein Pmani_033408 [Petrolisthes manimaculis]KAK4312271.1 hypothetical protein Pmani_016282 [Petrolisthes manimaculis]
MSVIGGDGGVSYGVVEDCQDDIWWINTSKVSTVDSPSLCHFLSLQQLDFNTSLHPSPPPPPPLLLVHQYGSCSRLSLTSFVTCAGQNLRHLPQ